MSLQRGASATVTYVAFDYTNNFPKTGDAANHSLRLVRDGVESTPIATPTEVDASGAPGVYSLNLSANEMNAKLIVVMGKSSTAGVSIIPETFVTEET